MAPPAAEPHSSITYLQGAGVGEGHVPGVGLLVHGVQVQCGLQLTLSTRQEHDARHGRGHTALQ